MRRFVPRWLFSLLTHLLVLSTTSLPCSADFLFVPQGATLTTSEDSYLCTAQDAKDTLALIRTLRGERDAWKAGCESLREEIDAYQERTESRLAALSEALNAEMKARRSDRARTTLMIVFAAGVGYLAGR